MKKLESFIVNVYENINEGLTFLELWNFMNKADSMTQTLDNNVNVQILGTLKSVNSYFKSLLSNYWILKTVCVAGKNIISEQVFKIIKSSTLSLWKPNSIVRLVFKSIIIVN